MTRQTRLVASTVMQIRVLVTVAILDRILAECRAIGAALERHCSEIKVRRRTRENGVWIIELLAWHPQPKGEVLYVRCL